MSVWTLGRVIMAPKVFYNTGRLPKPHYLSANAQESIWRKQSESAPAAALHDYEGVGIHITIKGLFVNKIGKVLLNEWKRFFLALLTAHNKGSENERTDQPVQWAQFYRGLEKRY